MELTNKGLFNKEQWLGLNYQCSQMNRSKMIQKTSDNPYWIHFGAGNIFRAFQANIAQKCLDEKLVESGLIVAEGFDYELVDKVLVPHDNLSILVTLKANGSVEKKIIESIANSYVLDSKNEHDFECLKEIFRKESLQLASFTITEKGYALVNMKNEFLEAVLYDFEHGLSQPISYLGKVTALLYERFITNASPIAMVSMDNCSHNGDKLKASINTYLDEWLKRGFIPSDFVDYVNDEHYVSFPWTMIDKITPRPDLSVEEILNHDGVEQMHPMITEKNTYIAPFVNAEESEYLVIEDQFPNGRPPFEKVGVIFTDQDTVERVEKMKVCTCLNPLHTSLAIFGCLLGYTKIHEEMNDPQLLRLIQRVGYEEGLPVVTSQPILDPKEFIDTVLQKRFPNPFMPDSPQRIATDTSQKLAIRFGETIKNYLKQNKDIHELKMIPLVFAGWLRYLMGIDDNGQPFELSSDPLLESLCPIMNKVHLNDKTDYTQLIMPILENEQIFGVNLVEAGLANTVCHYFHELIASKGAVREVLLKYTNI